MTKRSKRIFALLSILLFITPDLQAQSGGAGGLIRFEFINQSINDILFSLSTYTGIPIIADHTVSGNFSFQFAGRDFEKGFSTFLLTNRLYVEKTPELWTVTRVLVETDNTGAIKIDALDASPAEVLETLSRKTNTTIIQDILPSSRLSLHINGAALSGAVELVMKPFPDYTVTEYENYIQIRKLPGQMTGLPSLAGGQVTIRESGGLFEVSGESVKLLDVLNSLFSAGGREYSSFVRGDIIIERLKFSGKPFEQALELVLDQANAEAAEVDDLWYILPAQQNDILRKYRDEGKFWRRFEFRHISSGDGLSLVQSQFPLIRISALPDRKSFLAFSTEETFAELQYFMATIDVPGHTEAIRLKYIRTEELFRYLPPSVSREELIDSGNGNTVFFRGAPEKLAVFLKELEVIDRPQPRIRYDLLIIQYQETSNFKWGFSAEARRMRPGDMTMVTGSFGNLLNLNFDAITVFGYQFAAKMNASLAENLAQVFADTTLYGLSGQEIKFQNTSTYRYRDSNIDPETGKPIYSGVTREIVSGLILDIKGWVSGDGMITTDVTATVSKRGADVSSSIGNPPPTSEKIITTQVRGRSGETVVLSGLRQNDATIVEEKVPRISRVPILGWFFKSKNNTTENTQMIIYLVPHVDLGSDEYAVEGLKTASIYNRLVVPFLEP